MLHPCDYSRKKPKYFAVYDIETTTDLKNVYLVHYYNGLIDKVFESDPMPPQYEGSAMAQFLRWLLKQDVLPDLYAHNGGNFDHVFVLSCILQLYPELKVKVIPSNSSILVMDVSIPRPGGKKRRQRFLDSAKLIPASLDSLAKTFLGKSKMLEDIDYETLHTSPLRYEYVKSDCHLLYDSLQKYFEIIRNDVKGAPGVSAAQTSLKTYRMSYQPMVLPDISEHAAKLARDGYYGGRCEVLRRQYGRLALLHQLHCYDVNSMYPWAMRQPQPTEELSNVTGYKPDLTGFVEATVSVRRNYLPILPCRVGGKLCFPTGKWRGVFSTAELRLAETYGQLEKFQYHDSVYFATEDIFARYVDTLYAFRDKSNPNWTYALDRTAKLALNTLYGKFGARGDRETIHIHPPTSEVIEKKMTKLGNLNLDCWLEKTTTTADYMLPQISAWVTALGRCRLAEQLIECGGEAYYCDTDSIYTTRTLGTDGNLGGWKDEYLEDPIVYAYFLSPKIYVLRHLSGKLTNKAKGFSKFGQHRLPPDIVETLKAGRPITVSRFAKMRSVLGGQFGLIEFEKRTHESQEKRVFDAVGGSIPIHLEEP